MPTEENQHVTVLLARIRTGDDAAKADLLGVAYTELRALAGHIFRDQPGDHTLSPTALVNELCVKLLDSENIAWQDRKHFFRVAAKAMRNLLTDHARAKGADRRGGAIMTVSLDAIGGAARVAAAPGDIDLVVLDETLTRLAALDERMALIFELRFLAGFSVTRTAEIAEVSERTVEVDTRFIRAWLQKELHS